MINKITPTNTYKPNFKASLKLDKKFDIENNHKEEFQAKADKIGTEKDTIKFECVRPAGFKHNENPYTFRADYFPTIAYMKAKIGGKKYREVINKGHVFDYLAIDYGLNELAKMVEADNKSQTAK